MPFASIGPLTELIEGAATAVGGGMLLGGFGAGLVGVVKAWPQGRFDRAVLQWGYFGGALSAIVMAVDITFHYAY